MNMPVVIPGTLGHHVDKDMPEWSKKVSKISENLTAQRDSEDEPESNLMTETSATLDNQEMGELEISDVETSVETVE